MGVGDGLHDGQAEAAAAGLPGRAGRWPGGICRMPGWRPRGHAGPGVDHLDEHAAGDLAQPDGDRRGDRRVRADVAQQVGQHLPDARLVDDRDQPGRRLRPDRPLRLDGRGVGDRVPDDPREVGLGQVQRRGPVQPGQLEQLGDQRAHPLGFLLDPAHGVGQLLGAERALPVQLGVAADSRERRAQLVRGVGGELAHLLLRSQPGAERLLDPVEHRVDRRPEPADLGLVVGVGHPGGQVAARGDLVGGSGHLVERFQAAPDEPLAAEWPAGDEAPSR